MSPATRSGMSITGNASGVRSTRPVHVRETLAAPAAGNTFATRSTTARTAFAEGSLVHAGSDEPPPGARHGLTRREVEVLRYIVAGRSNPAIAEALFISPRTAQTHAQNIFGKLGVGSRAEAVRIAVERGLV